MQEDKVYVTYGLQDTYCDVGEYKFKVVLNPFFFKNAHECDAKIVGPSGKDIKYTFERWGRKMNFCFEIDNNVSEGLANIELNMRTKKGQEIKENLKFWIVI